MGLASRSKPPLYAVSTLLCDGHVHTIASYSGMGRPNQAQPAAVMFLWACDPSSLRSACSYTLAVPGSCTSPAHPAASQHQATLPPLEQAPGRTGTRTGA